MADQTRSSREVIRAAIDGWWRHYSTHSAAPEQIKADLAERLDRALFGDGSHEQSAAHWRANAAEEKRKKQHVSGLLAEALRERDRWKDAALDAGAEAEGLAGLQEEIRRLLTVLDPVDVEWAGGISETFPARLARRQEMAYAAIDDYPRIAAVLREHRP